MDIHGISKDIPCIYQAYAGGLHIRGIYQAYARHIPKIGVPDGERERDPPGRLHSAAGERGRPGKRAREGERKAGPRGPGGASAGPSRSLRERKKILSVTALPVSKIMMGDL